MPESIPPCDMLGVIVLHIAVTGAVVLRFCGVRLFLAAPSRVFEGILDESIESATICWPRCSQSPLVLDCFKYGGLWMVDFEVEPAVGRS